MNVISPVDWIAIYNKKYPLIEKQVKLLIENKGKNDLPDWPRWCFLPINGRYSIVRHKHNITENMPISLVSNVYHLAAIGAWRYNQTIYRFDENLLIPFPFTLSSSSVEQAIEKLF